MKQGLFMLTHLTVAVDAINKSSFLWPLSIFKFFVPWDTTPSVFTHHSLAFHLQFPSQLSFPLKKHKFLRAGSGALFSSMCDMIVWAHHAHSFKCDNIFLVYIQVRFPIWIADLTYIQTISEHLLCMSHRHLTHSVSETETLTSPHSTQPAPLHFPHNGITTHLAAEIWILI